MNKLNCQLGDIAVTVGCQLLENTGNIVQIIDIVGYKSWYGMHEQPFVWLVETTANRPLIYENEDGNIEKVAIGPVPDCFLIPIRPNVNEKDLTDFANLEIKDFIEEIV